MGEVGGRRGGGGGRRGGGDGRKGGGELEREVEREAVGNKGVTLVLVAFTLKTRAALACAGSFASACSPSAKPNICSTMSNSTPSVCRDSTSGACKFNTYGSVMQASSPLIHQQAPT